MTTKVGGHVSEMQSSMVRLGKTRWSMMAPTSAIAMLLIGLWAAPAWADSRPCMDGLSCQANDGAYSGLEMDWIRGSLLVGLAGQIGGRFALFTLKLEHAYVAILQGGFTVNLSNYSGRWAPLILYGFAGPEAGYMTRKGPHWFSVGVQVGFGIQFGGALTAEVVDYESGAMGAMLSPTFRYRYYLGRLGFEVSAEWPMVIDGGGIGTPWPIIGIGIGM